MPKELTFILLLLATFYKSVRLKIRAPNLLNSEKIRRGCLNSLRQEFHKKPGSFDWKNVLNSM